MLGPKVEVVRSEGYRRLVAALPCIACGVEQLSQCAHACGERGLGQKASDLETFALCATRPGEPGCHVRHDQLIGLTLETRREREKLYVRRTQAILIESSWDDRRARAVLVKVGLVKA